MFERSLIVQNIVNRKMLLEFDFEKHQLFKIAKEKFRKTYRECLVYFFFHSEKCYSNLVRCGHLKNGQDQESVHHHAKHGHEGEDGPLWE